MKKIKKTVCFLALFTPCVYMCEAEEKLQFNNTPIEVTVGNQTFEMIPVEGCTPDSINGYVGLDSYYIAKTEVTQGLWEMVMGTNPSFFKSPVLPVENISWEDAQAFLTKLNEKTGKKFRLPTEFEWEFAAKGGNKSKGYKYSGGNKPELISWNDFNSGDETHPVAQKQPNELGIYDMSGNVEEWCDDIFFKVEKKEKKKSGELLTRRYLDVEVVKNTTKEHVLKGGSWSSRPNQCLIVARRGSDFGNHKVGMRICMDAEK